MDGTGLLCNGCGSSNITFDPKTRKVFCHQCGREETYSRATLNRNGKVVYAKENALNFFKEAKYDDAIHYAREALDILNDYAPAKFILSYCQEFISGGIGSLKRFFSEIKPVSLEYDEVRDLKFLIETAVSRLSDYEEDIIELMASNMQAEEDIPELSEFVEKTSANIISRRTSSVYLNDKLLNMYIELAGHCAIPKTCLALLKSIEKNPDSPYVTNSFYMKSKTAYFYEHYVTSIGKVLSAMRESEYKVKFQNAYEQIRKKYVNDMNS